MKLLKNWLFFSLLVFDDFPHQISIELDLLISQKIEQVLLYKTVYLDFFQIIFQSTNQG